MDIGFQGIKNWLLFIERDSKNFEKNIDGKLLKLDINAYFEHISIKELFRILQNYNLDGEALAELRNLLFIWSNEEIGLPQGNNCSSFLSNVYLSEVDQAMVAEGFDYYRYVDDVKVFCRSNKEVYSAIKKFTELIRPLNLHINGGKLEIIDRQSHLSRSNQFRNIMDGVNYLLSFHDIRMYQKIDEDLQKVWKSAISEKEIDKQKFNYCINRFRMIQSEFPLQDILKNNLYPLPFIKEVSSYLKYYSNKREVQESVVIALLDAVYDYQMIYLLKVLYTADDLHIDLNIINKDKIYGSSNYMLIGYYMLLMAKFGNAGHKQMIKNEFTNRFIDNEKIARYFMIALQFYTNYKMEMNKLVRRIPALEFTRKYLLERVI